MIRCKLYARFLLVREKALCKDVIQDLSTVHQKPCKYFLGLGAVPLFYHVMSCTCQALSELLFVLFRSHLAPSHIHLPASCKPQHLALVGNAVQGSGDLFKKLPPQNEVMNSYLFYSMKSQEL